MAKFSIIIPVYNGGEYIENTLVSAARQSFKDYEIIICDDGSTDSSARIIRNFTLRHPETKIHYIFQENKGLGAARNTALRNAGGEFFALLDQDDIWYADKLQVVNDIFEQDKDASVVCHNQLIRKKGIAAGFSSYGPAAADMFLKLLMEGNCLSTSATAFRRQVIENAGFFSEDRQYNHFLEDYDLWLRASLKGFKFYFIKDTLGEITVHAKSYSRKNREIMCRHEINVVNSYYNNNVKKTALNRYKVIKRRSGIYAGFAIDFLTHGQVILFIKYFSKALFIFPLITFVLFKKLAIKCGLLTSARRGDNEY
jgi:glycosyltransferase involved in cell wall biosynthesis